MSVRLLLWFTVLTFAGCGATNVAEFDTPQKAETTTQPASDQHVVSQPAAKEPVETALSSLVLEGPELHELLRTRKIGSIQDLPTGIESPANPHISTDEEFVHAVARGGSQGRLGRDGIRTALFARYSTGENELGFYGLEAESEADADEREQALREIWAHNGRHGRSRVHRQGLVLLVVWHDDVPSECWESANATVLEQLNAPLLNED